MGNYKFKISKFLLSKLEKSYVRYIFDFANFGFGFIVATAIAAVVVILTNKTLSPSELGKFTYYRSIIEFLANCLTLTLYQSYLRFNIGYVDSLLYKVVKRVTIISLCCLFVITLIWLHSIFAALYAFFILYNERMYFHRSLMNISKVNYIRILEIIIPCSLLLVYNSSKQHIDSNCVFGFYGLGYATSLLFVKNKSKKIITSLRIKTILQYSVPGLLLVLTNWCTNYLSQIVIKQYYDFTLLAEYSIAQRSLLVIRLFTGLILMFFPVVYFREMKKGNVKLIRDARKLMFFVIFVVVTLCILFANGVYIFMGARQYLQSILLFKILSASELVYFAASILSLFFSYKIQTYKSLAIYGSGALLNCLLLMLFLRQYGIMFAAFSSLFSNCVILVLSFIFSYLPERKLLNQFNQ